jgi:hypothetical protein
LAVVEGFGGVEEPVEDLADLGGGRAGPEGGEVALGVLDRAGQDVQVVVQCVELGRAITSSSSEI